MRLNNIRKSNYWKLLRLNDLEHYCSQLNDLKAASETWNYATCFLLKLKILFFKDRGLLGL